MTDDEVIAKIKQRIAERKLMHMDLVHYLNRSSQMVSMLISGRRRWQPSDMTALRLLLEKFSVVA